MLDAFRHVRANPSVQMKMDTTTSTSNSDTSSNSSKKRILVKEQRVVDNDDTIVDYNEDNNRTATTRTTMTTREKDSVSQEQEQAQEQEQVIECSSKSIEEIYKECIGLKLEAIFHPKFDNERKDSNTVSGDSKIRERMIANVQNGLGYLELSIKHSGSLLLWSGGIQRYYSKNSSNNIYTKVGEILLKQHFVRSYWDDNSNKNDDRSSTGSNIIRRGIQKYEECCHYVERNRLTLSFEIVTSTILGDHGDRPQRDFLILTAVADRNTATFYTTYQIVQFAQQFRLPHNDIYITSTVDAVQKLFHFYDTELRENGTSSMVTQQLSTICTFHIPSIYPHCNFQGNIMEGFVIRYVPFDDNHNTTVVIIDSIQKLASKSKQLCQLIPPSRPDCFELIKNREQRNNNNKNDIPNDWYSILSMNLRSLIQLPKQKEEEENKNNNIADNDGGNVNEKLEETDETNDGNNNSTNNYNRFDTKLDEIIRKNIPQMATNDTIQYLYQRQLYPFQRNTQHEINHWIVQLAQKFKQSESTSDMNDTTNDTVTTATSTFETRNIAAIINNLSKIATSIKDVKYSCYEEIVTRTTTKLLQHDDTTMDVDDDIDDNKKINNTTTTTTTKRYICIVHILHDTTFQKFNHQMQNGDLPLFRGFSFEMIIKKQNSKYDNGDRDVHMLDRDNTTQLLAPMGEEVILQDNFKKSIDIYADDESNANNVKNENQSTDATTVVEEDQYAGAANKRTKINNDDITATANVPNENLMLKMKFLPYMIRTFGCRNGLSIIKNNGPTAFQMYMSNLFNIWGISHEKRNELMPFLCGWGEYATECFQNGDFPLPSTLLENTNHNPLPPLSSTHYLDHFYFYEKLFATRRTTRQKDSSTSSSSSSFQGLVVVIAVTNSISEIVSRYIASKVGCSKLLSGTQTITRNTMSLACTIGHGQICSTTVEEGPNKIRSVTKEFGDFITLILFGCSDPEMKALSDSPDIDTRKIKGVLSAWNKVRCRKIFDIPMQSLFPEGRIDNTPEINLLKPSQAFLDIVQKLECQQKVKDERPGLLLFFPTLPGSGKSALCADCDKNVEITRVLDSISKNGEQSSDPRNIAVLVGDKIKQKYWPHVKVTHSRDTSSIVITDKNAPKGGAWETIGQICGASKAFAVPIIPHSLALTTTSITGGRQPDGTISTTAVNQSHCYPFSLAFLALCLTRVLDRPPGSHAGRLDTGAKGACMIVIKFYCLYRGTTSEEFLTSISRSISMGGGLMSYSPIEVPIFRDGMSSDLPKDYKDLLIEAIQFMYGDEVLKFKAETKNTKDTYTEDLDTRLRSIVQKHRDHILSLSVPLEESQKAFIAALSEQIYHVDSIDVYEKPSKPFAKLACIDVAVQDVHGLLYNQCRDPRFAPFFELMLSSNSQDEDLPEISQWKTVSTKCLVMKTHVTMAHHKHITQKALRETFEPLNGLVVNILITGLLWSEKNAALVVHIPPTTISGYSIPPCQNEFSHITVWHAEGTSAAESNSLPTMAANGFAIRIDFDSPIPFHGVFHIWE